MNLFRRILCSAFLWAAIGIAALLGLAPSSDALIRGSGPYDTLLVIAAGDSNSLQAQHFDGSLDTTTPNLFQISQTFVISLAQEPLNQVTVVSGDIGPNTKLAQLLIANGYLPAGVRRVVIIPSAWAGTGLSLVAGNTGFWNVAGSRQALDGDGGSVPGLYALINRAKILYPHSKIWYVNWIEGANDGSWTGSAWTSAMQALWGPSGEFVSKYPEAANAPIIVSGIPPDRTNTALGNQDNLGAIITAQQAIHSAIPNAFYVDPSAAPILHSYPVNAFVHYNAASDRGGTYNFDTSAFLWSSGTTYNVNPAGTSQTVVVASDGFLYTTLVNGNIGNDPSGNAHPTLWAQQYSSTATVNVTDSLAYRQYQALINSGLLWQR